MKGSGPDGLVRPVKPSWEAAGSRELKNACTISAYAVMEMAGVPYFSGGLALKIVALALHTLHAILFSVVLGWAVPDLIRWESEVLRIFSGYQKSLGVAKLGIARSVSDLGQAMPSKLIAKQAIKFPPPRVDTAQCLSAVTCTAVSQVFHVAVIHSGIAEQPAAMLAGVPLRRHLLVVRPPQGHACRQEAHDTALWP